MRIGIVEAQATIVGRSSSQNPGLGRSSAVRSTRKVYLLNSITEGENKQREEKKCPKLGKGVYLVNSLELPKVR